MPKSTASKKHSVSIRQWMLLQFLTLLPIVGLVVTLVMAFAGQDQTRKNFFRALIVWAVVFVAIHLILFFALLSTPTIALWVLEITKWCKQLWASLVDIFPRSN